MTISYTIGENPIWYFADIYGKPLGGGKMYTYHNQDRTSQKFVYQDASGNLPWTDPIIFDSNGSQGTFWFQFDSNFPDDTYYIEVYDSNGNLQYTIENYSAGNGSGGGNSTTTLDLQNYIVNNTFWRNIGSSANPVPSSLTLCPGNHVNFCGSILPDVTFFKSSASTANDQIIFQSFFGLNPLTNDVTPTTYLEYVCSNVPINESAKYIQYPIVSGVQNLSNTTMTFSIWARVNGASPGNTLDIELVQFFGDGTGASPTVSTPISLITLTSSWVKYTATVAIPNVATATLGLGGFNNDCVLLRIGLPLASQCTIDIAKPSLYLGNVVPQQGFELNDFIDAVANSPRTGDIRMSLNDFQLNDWVIMDDGTIGNSVSNATTRAKDDTYALFDLIWNKVQGTLPGFPSIQLAQLYDSTGAPVSRGATSKDDYAANRAIALTKMLGRVIAGTIPLPITRQYGVAAPSTILTLSGGTSGFNTGVPIVLSGTIPSPLQGGVTYYVSNLNTSPTTLSLAPTPNDAMAGTNLFTITSNGAGQFITVADNALATWLGEQKHLLTVAELATHHHTIPGVPNPNYTAAGGQASYDTTGVTSTNTSDIGDNTPHNTMQPTVFMNIFMKL